MLYDVLNQSAIDSEIAPYASSEHDLLMKHINKTKVRELLLPDRGYLVFGCFYYLKHKALNSV